MQYICCCCFIHMSYRTHIRNRLTHKEAASILANLKFAIPYRRPGDSSSQDNTTDSSSDDASSSDASSSDTDSDDDVIVYEGRRYDYHPPEVGDRVRVLCPPDWYVGEITKTNDKRSYPYTVVFRETAHSKKETYFMALKIEDYPSKWHFQGDGLM